MKANRRRHLAVNERHRLPAGDAEALVGARHPAPRSVLGYHEYPGRGRVPACVVRVLEPDAAEVAVHWSDEEASAARPLKRIHPGGLFEGRLPHRRPLVPYRLVTRYADGSEHSRPDPYYFSPQLSDYDLYLFGEGNHHRIYRKLGAHPEVVDGTRGTRFAVWAPNAERVSVVGPFNLWDGRRHPLQVRGSSGVWELFVPDVDAGMPYKYEIRNRNGRTLLKSDPYGFAMQPGCVRHSAHRPGDILDERPYVCSFRAMDPENEPGTADFQQADLVNSNRPSLALDNLTLASELIQALAVFL